jgi:transcriptional regulator of acetoin/glycerol metabolism
MGVVEEAALRRITDAELARRRGARVSLIEVAVPRLRELLARLPGLTNVGYLADADGIVLFSTGPREQIEAFGLAPGYGGAPPGHCACTSAPLFAHDRNLVGAIGVTSSAGDERPDRLAEVIRVALDIEQELYARWRRSVR